MSFMDHYFQMDLVAPAEQPMLEGYAALGFVAGKTERLRLRLLVTGVTYRHPGLLAKTVTSVDVLSGGRCELGIGAAWYEREHRGLGVPFPPTAERFERLEEAIQICLQMWSDNDGAYHGKHYQLEETLCRPVPVSAPRPKILIGGGGERKTLRYVARYAQACNLFAGPDLARKLDVLRAHCDAENRVYDEIRKTCYYIFDVGPNGEKANEIIDGLGALAEMGFDTAIGAVANVWEITPLEIIGGQVIPMVADL